MLEEDEELREIWARLLVNAGDASNEMELRTAYVEILRGMSSFDVRNLKLMSEAYLGSQEQFRVVETWNLPESAKLSDKLTQAGEVSPELGISLANLARLGCAIPSGGWDGVVLLV